MFLFSKVLIVFRQTADRDSRVSPFGAHNWTLLFSSLESFAQSMIYPKFLIAFLIEIE
jgi:hypothetical protein